MTSVREWLRSYDLGTYRAMPRIASEYADEAAWNDAYVRFHHRETTDAMVYLLRRFATMLSRDAVSLEHVAFFIRVAKDGLCFINDATKIEAAKLVERLTISYPESAKEIMDMACMSENMEVALLGLRARARTFKTLEPGSIARALHGSFHANRSAYETLREIVDRYASALNEEDKRLTFERLIVAAALSDDPRKWLKSAASLYVHDENAVFFRTPALHRAISRFRKTRVLCDPWYVHYLDFTAKKKTPT